DHFAATWLRFMLNGPGLPGSNSRSAGGNTCGQLSPPSVDTAMRGSLQWGSTPHATIAPSAVAAATASGKNSSAMVNVFAAHGSPSADAFTFGLVPALMAE